MLFPFVAVVTVAALPLFWGAWQRRCDAGPANTRLSIGKQHGTFLEQHVRAWPTYIDDPTKADIVFVAFYPAVYRIHHSLFVHGPLNGTDANQERIFQQT